MSVMIRETLVERRQVAMRWGAVVAGAIVAVAFGLLFQLAVLGVGLEHFGTDQGPLAQLGVGTGVWWAVAAILALFIGGICTGRLSGLRRRGVTAWHGAVMWSLVVVGATALGVWAVGNVAGGGGTFVVAQTATDAQHEAIAKSTETGEALLWLTLAMAAGLASAVIGGALGAARRATATATTAVETDAPVP